MTKTKTRVVWMVVLALLASPSGVFAQEPVKVPANVVEKKFLSTTLGWTGVITAFVGALVMVPMKDPNATDYNIKGDSFCVTTNTTRQRVDVTDGSCTESEPMIKAGLITMGIGGAMALIGFHKVTVSPQVGHKVVGAKMSVKW
jgi:hypothetical protein